MQAFAHNLILILSFLILVGSGDTIAASKKKQRGGPKNPPPVSQSLPDPKPPTAVTPEDQESRERLLDEKKPPLWGTLKESLRLTSAYLQDPKANAQMLPLIQSMNKALVPLLKEDKAAEQTMRHILGGAMLNPAEHKSGGYFDEMAKVAALFDKDKRGRKFGQFRKSIAFDELMGAIGQNSLENKPRFDQFAKLASGYDGRGSEWHTAYEAHQQNVQALEKSHAPFQRVSRIASLLAQFGFAIPVGMIVPDYLFGHVPLDVNLLAVGFTWELSRGPIGRAVGKFMGNFRGLWTNNAKQRVQGSFDELYSIDPERTIPLLVADATREEPKHSEGHHEPTLEDAEKLKPLEDAALAVLLARKDDATTRALVELGIRFLRSGYRKGAEEVFGELAKRAPGTEFERLYNDVQAAIKDTRSIESTLNQVATKQRWGRVVIFGAPVAAGVYAVSHQLHGEELTLAITIMREALVGSLLIRFILGQGNQHAHDRRASLHHEEAEKKLSEGFSKLPSSGPHGLDILKALAENNLPGELGALIAKVARKAIAETPGAAAAQTARSLSPKDSADAVASSRLALDKEIGARGQHCNVDYGYIGKYYKPRQ